MEPAEAGIGGAARPGGTGGGVADQHFFDGGQIVARDIPAGWVQAAEFDTRKPGSSKKDSPSGIYRLILRSCEQGTIRSYKDGGRWVVNRDDVEELRRVSEIAPEKESSPEIDNEKLSASLDLMRSEIAKLRTEVSVVNGIAVRAIGSLLTAMNQIRDAIVDLKTPAIVEPKQETGPY